MVEKERSSQSAHGGQAFAAESFLHYAFPSENSCIVEKGSSSKSGQGGHAIPPETFYPYGLPTVTENSAIPQESFFNYSFPTGPVGQPYVWPHSFQHGYSGEAFDITGPKLGGFSQLLMSAQDGSLSIPNVTALKEDCDEGYLGGAEYDHDHEDRGDDDCAETENEEDHLVGDVVGDPNGKWDEYCC